MTGKKEKEKRKKRILFLVATNVVASRPPERRPTGTPHARAKKGQTETRTHKHTEWQSQFLSCSSQLKMRLFLQWTYMGRQINQKLNMMFKSKFCFQKGCFWPTKHIRYILQKLSQPQLKHNTTNPKNWGSTYTLTTHPTHLNHYINLMVACRQECMINLMDLNKAK